jgi:hypothetical protein
MLPVELFVSALTVIVVACSIGQVIMFFISVRAKK